MKKTLIFAFAALALMCSCKKKAEPVLVSVTTGAATAVGTDGATLQGSVSVSGADVSEALVSFRYSATESTVDGLLASGIEVSAVVGGGGIFHATLQGGLAYGTTYHFVAVATVRGELFHGTVKSFRTELAPEAVDLGLSVKWASCNLGATKPEEYGDYYTWGETEPKGNYWGSNYDALTKYCPSDKAGYWKGTGDPDGKTVLDPEDDAAAVRLGGSWRMPTDEEFTELRSKSNCTWEWSTRNGINGYKVTSNKAGFTDRWIFLPAAGGRDDADHGGVGSYGFYWSSSLSTDYPDYAWGLYFDSGGVSTYTSYGRGRYYGRSVRPVSE